LDKDIFAEYHDLVAVENALGSRLAEVRRDKARLKAEMASRSPDDRAVTDHALVRFLERVEGQDVEAIRARLRAMLAECVAVGSDFMVHKEGAVFVIGTEGQVVTVITREQAQEHEHRRAIVERALADIVAG